MNSKYTPPQRKEVTSIAIDQDVREWVDKNIPQRARSDFFNSLAKRYIKRHEAAMSALKVSQQKQAA